ncbi:hypothetical protein G7058_02300 [Jeotgalibaca porci]|uniref:Helix-hairpin-helix DNA-binding motif class 1 domain-containing protein n=1 Tax=Jeotgalibaca porci TaxID=1868793 RepID=A0A6G7WFD4_9LACT|nr:helix-hairpin-helix domain-containing protein [Jeotgalibaca porci]QIK50984.1 hypothetical protein G7058_02300 [Jeotgalibaca porci]
MEKITKWRIPLLIGLGIVQGLIIIGLVFSNQKSAQTENTDEWFLEMQSESESIFQEPEEQEPVFWVVDVKGAVTNPGIYEVAKNMRVQNAIDLAGGLLQNAETRHINFAQHVTDQMLLYIPVVGEEIVDIPYTQPNSPVEEGTSKININTATDLELQALPGIGEKKALQIINYRTENGSFSTIEELMEVSGIGQKTFDTLKESITVTK